MINIQLKKYTDYKEDEIVNLYNSDGWINYTNNTDMLRNAYSNSLDIIGAYDGEKLVGIIRVVGDGYSIIYIQDIIVLPEYQRNGIGTMLLETILSTYKHVYQKRLATDNEEKTVNFYKKLQFIPDSEIDCVTFVHFSI